MADNFPGTGRKATTAEAFVIGGAGVLIAWVCLAVGVVAGFGAAGWIAGSSVPIRWTRLTGDGSLGVAVLFGMAGYLIEALRFQGPPRPGRFFRAWAAAGRLRFGLFVVLAVAAVGIGLFAGLWWSDGDSGDAADGGGRYIQMLHG
ncbi:MAG: hypothetical protein ACRC7O_10900 [Fimbriiglobus sp.]